MPSADSNPTVVPDVVAAPTTAGTEVQTTELPVAPIAAVLFGLLTIFVVALHLAFPLIKPAPELLVPFPPDEIAVAREAAFQRGRLLNPLIAMSSLAFLTAIALPLVLSKKVSMAAGWTKLLVPNALLAAVLAACGVGLGHLIFESTNSESLGITRTFLARWVEFAFFGCGVGAAVGAALGGRVLALEKALTTGLVANIGALLLDLIYVPIATAQVDVLVPGGVSWGNKDLLALGLFAAALGISVTIGLTNKGKKR